MAFTREEVHDCVLSALRHMLADPSAEIDETTNPIRGLGFISDDGLDFACEISDRLNFHFPDKKNPFVDDSGRRARRVGEIIDLICPMVQENQEAAHGRH